jgi:hypothetical protein
VRAKARPRDGVYSLGKSPRLFFAAIIASARRIFTRQRAPVRELFLPTQKTVTDATACEVTAGFVA